MNYSMYPIGDSALQIKLPNANALLLHQFSTSIHQNRCLGVHDIVPGLETITIFYQFPQTNYYELEAKLITILQNIKLTTSESPIRTLYIPTLYDGPDLLEVAHFHKTTPENIIEWHSTPTYEVSMLGFLPGFPYLSGLPACLHTPRKKEPRLQVEAGSIGIGGSSTGIYPIASPGGWNLIGRTSVSIFSLEEEQPFLFQQGDKVKFVSVSELVKSNREDVIFYEKN
ncbi:5-oxoprolinase subunit PxpB [Bacillus sp. FJAT-45066]|uniref:5-oxoprolinase subunit PxpB n=1 Tax=Bacillus sp. FJAT-45066 TaxID=2011010 RepID=UPI000BB8DECE|nr:5-oxoprolinase subunit PxpB [Bacillus sp. FJAT-45066]